MKNPIYYSLKSNLLILSIAFFGLKFYQSTPIEEVMGIPHILFLGIMGILASTFLIRHLISKRNLNVYIVYLFSIMIIVPFWSMLRSNIAFGQPYYFGILAERNWLVICAGIVLYKNILKNPGFIDTIEKIFLRLSILTLTIYSSIYIFYDLSQFSEYLFVEETDLRGYRIKLNIFFINIGLFYQFIKFYHQRRLHNFLLFLFFFLYGLIVIQGRVYLSSIVMCLSIFIFYQLKEKTFSGQALYFIYSTMALSLFFFIISVFNPVLIENLTFMFSQLISVSAGDISYDPSANSRIFQSIIALGVISESSNNLWLGVGKLSHQWEKGYEGIFGHFFPTDLGVLGVLFEYGIIGIIFLNIIPIIACFVIMNRIKTNDLFLVSLKYTLLFYILTCFNTGNFLFSPQEYVLIFFIFLGLLKAKSIRLDPFYK